MSTPLPTEKRGPFSRAGRWLGNLLEGEQQSGKKNTIAVLDGVRAIAVLMVIVFHVNRVSGDNIWSWRTEPLTFAISTAGGTGVTLFFVLSGFLLFMPFAKALLSNVSWPLLRVYYMRRVFRIFPGYYVSLFLLIFFWHPEYLTAAYRGRLLLFLTFLMDASTGTFRQLNGPFWTLATEWQFYMILPLLCIAIGLLTRWVPLQQRLRAVALSLLAVILGGLALRFWGIYYHDHSWQSFLGMPAYLVNDLRIILYGQTGKYTEDFAVGMFISLLYIYAQRPSTSPSFTLRWQRLSPWLWGVGILILVFGAMWHLNSYVPVFSFLNGIFPLFSWLNEMLLAIGFGMCIAAILYGSESLQRVFSLPLVRWIGLISFSLYIWHLALLVLFQSRVLPLFHLTNIYVIYLLYWLWVLLVIFPFALLSFLFIEKPFMRLGDRLRKTIEKKYRESRGVQQASQQPAPQVEQPPVSELAGTLPRE